LKEPLIANYLEDNLNYIYYRINPDHRQQLDWYSFHKPFIYVGSDIYLTIMNLKPLECPAFVHEVNSVTRYWYEDIDNWPELKAVCHDCSARMKKPKLYTSHEIVDGWDLIGDVFQMSSNWCMDCQLTTLFMTVESPYPGCRRKFIDILENSSSDE